MSVSMVLGLVLYAMLMLFMVYAMMRFTLCLLSRPKRPRADAAASGLVVQRLLALDGREGVAVVDGGEGAIDFRWDGMSPATRIADPRARSTVLYRARLLLDDDRHEMRIFETLRHAAVFLRRDAHRVRLTAELSYRWGIVNAEANGRVYVFQRGRALLASVGDSVSLDTTSLKEAIRAVADACGWTYRPVLWPLQTRRASARNRRLTPRWLSRWPERAVWGVLYPLSYVLAVACLVAVGVPMDRHNVLALALISAGWWGVWGLLVWVLLGAPGLRFHSKGRP